MATINNSDLKKELIDGAKINTSVDAVPGALAEKVVPTMEVNPKLLRVCDVVKYGTAVDSTATIYTTPSDKDFYLSSLTLSASNGNAGSVIITATIKGVATTLSTLQSSITGGISTGISVNFPIPLKIDRGTNITTSSDNTDMIATSTIFGYHVED